MPRMPVRAFDAINGYLRLFTCQFALLGVKNLDLNNECLCKVFNLEFLFVNFTKGKNMEKCVSS